MLSTLVIVALQRLRWVLVFFWPKYFLWRTRSERQVFKYSFFINPCKTNFRDFWVFLIKKRIIDDWVILIFSTTWRVVFIVLVIYIYVCVCGGVSICWSVERKGNMNRSANEFECGTWGFYFISLYSTRVLDFIILLRRLIISRIVHCKS